VVAQVEEWLPREHEAPTSNSRTTLPPEKSNQINIEKLLKTSGFWSDMEYLRSHHSHPHQKTLEQTENRQLFRVFSVDMLKLYSFVGYHMVLQHMYTLCNTQIRVNISIPYTFFSAEWGLGSGPCPCWQALYHLRHTPNPFLLFRKRLAYFCSGLASDFNPSSAFPGDDRPVPPCRLIYWDGSFTNFFPRLNWNHDLLICSN
jgi:hypothetical protein